MNMEITEIIDRFSTEGNEGNEEGEPSLQRRLDKAADEGTGFLSLRPQAAGANGPFP